ncbi:hypothetical protein L228DRAFT_147771 [Xylona heveae TC161]|uniref:Protein EFR3 n=1 Tax=Xylona heveae (strain CBS 132557 / TC161) TaxID=1328760 RepID=A0A165GGU7_XYLHT|nr:hypothetical protein L228DRAFT_147771 [Xylona heveae TC161]KZF22169.1 hypothetical protein L228DRAFT_147771 [Xylona heveae TC161]
MNAVRQKCRPKHQVLVLKCYPKLQKNAAEVKPNSSELSYLLYYASTRRSKVQKVGVFLEKRTASDLWRGRIANVQITLQILHALIEKSPRDLSLFASSVLRILSSIVGSKDITLVEDSLPTLEALCLHQDAATLGADQEYNNQFQDLIASYASFAADHPPSETKGPISAPLAIRWRNVGLRAIKTLTSSEGLAVDAGRQFGRTIMPVILRNLWSDNDEYLIALDQREQAQEQTDKDQAVRRRMSVATVRTADQTDANVAVASGTAADADKEAEAEVGVLALQSLKQIFTVNNRVQVRAATDATLKFIVGKASSSSTHKEDSVPQSSRSFRGWGTTLIEMIAKWTPVQDRFVILVTAMESMVKSPVAEDDFERQIILATLVGWLLSSKVNLIGLSVMDVLLGLIHHIQLVLQLGGRGFENVPPVQPMDELGSEKVSGNAPRQGPSAPGFSTGEKSDVICSASPLRIELLAKLQKCIGDLATHVYYTDQISDMISALLARLKPNSASTVINVVSAITNPTAAANAISNSSNLQEKPNTDDFFSFGTARLTALQAVKEILVTANLRTSAAGASGIGRNKVRANVWDGTQWLLRDSDVKVQRAYVDALNTWMKFEVDKAQLQALNEPSLAKPAQKAENPDPEGSLGTTRRAVSNASRRDRSPKAHRTSFVELLHFAIYESARRADGTKEDYLVLHLLLWSMLENLGICALKSGLPMIFRLQEEIQSIDNPSAKVKLGSLVHGYLWTITEKYDLDTSWVGREIHNEISRRKHKGLWLDEIRVPALQLDQIRRRTDGASALNLPPNVLHAEALKPFDDRPALVELIAAAYPASVASPPSSPPSSPGRASVSASRSYFADRRELPARVKERMLSTWSQEAIIESIEKENSRAFSLNGSRAGTSRSATRNFLTVNGGTEKGSPDQFAGLISHQTFLKSRPPSMAYGLVGSGCPALRRASAQENPPTPISSSSRLSTVRVDELKRYLSGDTRAISSPRHDLHHYMSNDASSESMVSAGSSESQLSSGQNMSTAVHIAPTTTKNVAPADQANASQTPAIPRPTSDRPRSTSTSSNEPRREHSRHSSREGSIAARRLSGGGLATAIVDDAQVQFDPTADVVPPVPPLPPSLSLPGSYPGEIIRSPSSGNIAVTADGSAVPLTGTTASQSDEAGRTTSPKTPKREKSHSRSSGTTSGGGGGGGGVLINSALRSPTASNTVNGDKTRRHSLSSSKRKGPSSGTDGSFGIDLDGLLNGIQVPTTSARVNDAKWTAPLGRPPY